MIDLLTDSGTSAMSSDQWAGIMRGDESYAGAKSFYRFESAVKKITGDRCYYPNSPGPGSRKNICFQFSAEKENILSAILFLILHARILNSLEPKRSIILCEVGKHPEERAPFKGNMDVDALETFIKKTGKENIPLIMLTVTNNSGGGQPVSMQNIRDVKKCLQEIWNIPFSLMHAALRRMHIL